MADSTDETEARAETALALLAIALSGLFLFEGVKLKPGVFEPIGPGAVPMGVAVVTIVLSLLVLIGRWRKPSVAALADSAPDEAAPAPREQWRLLIAVGALTIVYTAVLQSGVARYGLVTAAYLLATFLLVAGRVRGELPWAIGLSLTFGLGLDFVFRHLLVADLP